MTAEERKEFEAYKAEKDKRRREQERKEQRKQYADMVDDEVCTAIPQLRELSEHSSRPSLLPWASGPRCGCRSCVWIWRI